MRLVYSHEVSTPVQLVKQYMLTQKIPAFVRCCPKSCRCTYNKINAAAEQLLVLLQRLF